ncbi:uncharacterized protein Dvir_GJ20384 [Drosophila virilis]|uniref:Uncharacterized protein n=1 Tax=Drosophila virilis TaxID=7244 RepID=B4LPU5_DROVI|nr:uncharacterized protein LOC6626779 [Drosophila virilis]EDW61285.1 uncharacterized protein Dvir_GJ20384 [Drosophila virilis]
MKVIIVALIACLAFASALPQIERGSIYAPSGRFAMTENWAAPPVDLSQPIVLLPVATPIAEAPQEPKLTARRLIG